MALGVLAGLLVLLLAAVTLACGDGCARYARLAPVARPMTHQAETAVRIEMLCVDQDPFVDDGTTGMHGAYGSGVIVDARHVLTAYHVVGCPYLADVHVVLPNGKRLRMWVEHEWPDHDVARLVIASADTFGAIAPPPMRLVLPTERGTGVCAAVSYPKREGTCGQLDAPIDSVCDQGKHGVPWCRNLELTMSVVPGNSGAPIYDSDGALIGLVTGTQVYRDGNSTGVAYGHTLPMDVMP